MLTLALLSAGLAAGLLAWWASRWVRHGWEGYREAFTEEARWRLDEFFVFVDPGQLWLLSVALCAAAVATAYVLSGSVTVALSCGGLGLLLPRWLAGRARHQRLARFDTQLPDALLALAWSLRAGASLPVALRSLMEESQAPLSQEFALLMREQRMGVSLDACLSNLHSRMPTESAGLMCAALRIATRTGGNLADALERIAANLRARLLIHRRIHALTAQGRLQAWVVGALPLVIGLALQRLEPEAMQAMWQTPAGWGVLALIVLLEVVGVWMIRRVMRIEV